jgi:hypothetical protein
VISIDEADGPARRYRILSLDGGGVKGTYTASVLCTLEAITGKKIAEHFDLITGTSTGGIIAIAMGLGIPLEKILDLYVSRGPEIFRCPAFGWVGRLAACWRHFRRPKHSQEGLQRALSEVFGTRQLGESKNRLVIPAFNAVNGDIQLFKTAHSSAYGMDYQRWAVDVALATSAAPTYFDAFADCHGRVFLDGGVWANCPAMVGLTEATANLGWPIDRIEILSIGTTAEPFDVSRKRRRGGIAQWNRGLVELLMAAQVRGTLGLASALTRHRIRRIDVTTRRGRFSLDNAEEIPELRALGENSARQVAQTICAQFLESPAERFEPCFSVAAGA